MELFYYKDEIANFGDDLNPWLWPKLLPSYFDDQSSDLFVGIGTLLNHKLPKDKHKYIFGAGAGYGTPPVIDDNWEIYAVRGPYTAKTLNISSDLIITDSAILITEVEEPVENNLGDIGFMPHYISHRLADWKNIGEECGLRYISPESSVEEVLREMKKCKAIYTEAMHGAIVADSLRIPWHPLILGSHVNTDKWKDWLTTVGLTYSPTIIPTVFNAEEGFSYKRKLKNELKRQIIKIGLGKNFYAPPPRKSNNKQRSHTCSMLQNTVKTSPHFLSTSETQKHLLNKYQEALTKFKYNYDKKL